MEWVSARQDCPVTLVDLVKQVQSPLQCGNSLQPWSDVSGLVLLGDAHSCKLQGALCDEAHIVARREMMEYCGWLLEQISKQITALIKFNVIEKEICRETYHSRKWMNQMNVRQHKVTSHSKSSVQSIAIVLYSFTRISVLISFSIWVFTTYFFVLKREN